MHGRVILGFYSDSFTTNFTRLHKIVLKCYQFYVVGMYFKIDKVDR